jgi:hypothetical protein
MKKLALWLILTLLGSSAWADGTIDSLSAGGAITGTEAIPMFQTANPAVKTTPNALDTYLSQTTKALTNKTVNCANNTCTVRIGSDVTGLGTGAATALAINTGSAGAFTKNNGDALTGTFTGDPTFNGDLTLSGGAIVFSGATSGTQDRCLGLTAANVLATSAGACGSGAGVSVTATTPNIVIDPTPGTGTFTIGTTAALNTQSGNSAYTILSTDAGKIVNRTNTVTQTDVSPQATGSFAEGFAYGYQTTTVGNILDPTTSTINGLAALTLGAQQAVDCYSDGTNWKCALGLPQPATQTGTTYLSDSMTWKIVQQSASIGWIATVNPNKAIIITVNQAVRITSIVGRVSDATGGTSTVQVNKAPSATACASGTALHSGTLNANGTANTNQTLTLVGGADDDLAAGDSICLVTTGTTEWTGGTGIGGITVNYQPI